MSAPEPGSEHAASTFAGEDWSTASLKRCRFEDCRFEDCTLTGADLSEAIFEDCRFERCELSGVKVVGTKLRTVRFEQSRLRGVGFADCYQLGLELAFAECNLDYASFVGLSLAGIAIVDCKLSEADFSETTLRDAGFSGSDLRGTIFRHADLRGADLRGTTGAAVDLATCKVRKLRLSMDSAIHTLSALGVVVDG